MPSIKINDITLYFEIYGSELDLLGNELYKKPTLIFIHGGPGIGDHSLYTRFWGQFQDLAQIIFIDMRGCGRSERGDPALWNLVQYGQDVYDFCKILNIEKPIVAGVSWGGYVALSYAVQYPNHPAGLILCNTEAHVSKTLRREFFLKISNSEEIADLVWRHDNHWSPEIQDEFIKKCMPFYSKNFYKKEEFERCVKNLALWEKVVKEELFTFDLRPELSKIICPVLQLAGTLDPVHPYPCAQETASGIAHSELHIIEGAADPVYFDKPEISSTLIRNFVKKLVALPQANQE